MQEDRPILRLWAACGFLYKRVGVSRYEGFVVRATSREEALGRAIATLRERHPSGWGHEADVVPVPEDWILEAAAAIRGEKSE